MNCSLLSKEQFFVIEYRDGKVYESSTSGSNLKEIQPKSRIEYIGGEIISNLDELKIVNFDFVKYFDIYGNTVTRKFVEQSISQGIFFVWLK
ncbi:hypothetical protein OAQ99_01625, partial [Candidatus Kapabacteria bacterium]|nr:hypothetical protein [Candidatus Kapabacteria bacterium]